MAAGLCGSLLVGCGSTATSTGRRTATVADPCRASGFIWIQTALIEDDVDFDSDEDRAYQLAAALVHFSPPMSEVEFRALARGLGSLSGVHGYRGAWRADVGIPRQAAIEARCAPEGTLAGPVRLQGQGWLVLRHMRTSEISSGEHLDAALARDAGEERAIDEAREPTPTERAVSSALEAFGRGVVGAAETAGRVFCLVALISSGHSCESRRGR